MLEITGLYEAPSLRTLMRLEIVGRLAFMFKSQIFVLFSMRLSFSRSLRIAKFLFINLVVGSKSRTLKSNHFSIVIVFFYGNCHLTVVSCTNHHIFVNNS